MVASPCDSDSEEDILLKEMLSTWVAADYRNMFTEEDDGSWTNLDEDGNIIQATAGIIGAKIKHNTMPRGKSEKSKKFSESTHGDTSKQDKGHNMINTEADEWLKYQREYTTARKETKRTSRAM